MLYFIPTPIGNLSDISFRALSILESCELLFCEDTRVSKSLIALLNAKFNTKISPKKFISLHSHNEKELLEKLDLSLFEKNVAYLSDAGMPGISDPGQLLVEFALKNNLTYEVLPGANAALVALVSSSFCKKEFIFMGFLSSKGEKRQKDLERLMSNPYPSIVYEAPKRILSLLKELANLNENKELFIIKEISKKFQTQFKGTAKELLKELENANLKGEWVVVVQGDLKAEFSTNSLCEKDILELDLPLKTKSKLLAKMSGKNPKEFYKKLVLS
ncbi:MAG: 16S rRNA (cytidine(1402)-2'-O)-methyltransferase [Campylobacter sp.]|nr:16S rRNA (cytidine(1402)-2'-O)-methyltransferase [Campylobacter sp.]